MKMVLDAPNAVPSWHILLSDAVGSVFPGRELCARNLQQKQWIKWYLNCPYNAVWKCEIVPNLPNANECFSLKALLNDVTSVAECNRQTTMTDEHKSNINSNSSHSSNNNNNGSSSNNDNNCNDDAASSSNSKNNNTSNESSHSNNNTSSIIAEAAAKFLLKNGLNGSSSTSYPPLPPPLPANLSRTTTPTTTTTPSSSSSTASNGFLPHAKTPKSSSIMAASAAVAASVVGATASKPTIDVLGGVLDYSSLGGAATGSLPTTAVVAAAAGTAKIGKGSNSGGSFDMGRTPISTHGNNSWGGYGGRLQFFKGKYLGLFIPNQSSVKKTIF